MEHSKVLSSHSCEQRQASVARTDPGVRLVQDAVEQLGRRHGPALEGATVPVRSTVVLIARLVDHEVAT